MGNWAGPNLCLRPALVCSSIPKQKAGTSTAKAQEHLAGEQPYVWLQPWDSRVAARTDTSSVRWDLQEPAVLLPGEFRPSPECFETRKRYIKSIISLRKKRYKISVVKWNHQQVDRCTRMPETHTLVGLIQVKQYVVKVREERGISQQMMLGPTMWKKLKMIPSSLHIPK